MGDPDNAPELERAASDGKWTPSIRDWTVEAELLAQILDRISDTTRATLASIPLAKGKTRPKYDVPSFPRPRTVLDDIEDERTYAAGAWLLAAFFPSHQP